jgi:hypothetical protein
LEPLQAIIVDITKMYVSIVSNNDHSLELCYVTEFFTIIYYYQNWLFLANVTLLEVEINVVIQYII